MSENRQARLLDLFDRAAQLPWPEQERFIDAQCADDPDLARRLRSLLTHDARRNTAIDGITPDTVTDVLREAVPGALLDGQVIGAWRVEKLLGTGGMGRVYLARRTDATDVNHAVAIKFVRPDRLEANVLARFSREWRLLASLHHPGICTFIDTGTLADGTPYVVMEYVEGEPLLEYCNQHQLGVRDRLLLFRKILAAVAHAHARLVVHRDLKGSNVYVTPDGETKLLDFGIAKSLADPDYSQTATTERFLTPINAAPELLHGEPTGTGCDIYALGVLAYELLAGRAPLKFDGLRSAQVENMILSVPPPPMSQSVIDDDRAARERGLENGQMLSRRLKGDLDAIVLRCLRKAPGERYATVLDLDADIARHLDQLPIRARHGDRLYRARRFISRHLVAVTLSLALLASLLISTLVLAWQSVELARQRNLALTERDHAQEVVQVLRDAFQFADPARAAGDEVSARQILDAARPRLDSLVEAQPHQFALLADTLASVELAVASEARAAELAQRGLAAAEASNADPTLIRRLRLTAARALTSLGDLEEAQLLLDTVRDLDSSPQPDWAVARARLAFNRLPESELAIELLSHAEASIQDLPPDNEIATDVRWQLAEALRRNGRHEEAIAVLEATEVWQQEHLSENHPRLALTRLRRLNALAKSGAPELALRELEDVVEQLLVQYGADSSMAGFAHSMLGDTLRTAGEPEAAIEQFRLAWGAWRHALGEDHANTLRLGVNLATALSSYPESIPEAITIMRDTLPRAEHRLGPERPLVIYIRSNLARMLGTQGRWHEALMLMGSGTALRADMDASPSNRQLQISVLRDILAQIDCESPIDDTIGTACANSRELLERLLHLDDGPAQEPSS